MFSLILGGYFTNDSCNTVSNIDGNFSEALKNQNSSSEIRLSSGTRRFEYSKRTEGSILKYSAGTWMQTKKTIILNGFTADKIDSVDIQAKIQSHAASDNLVNITFPHRYLDNYTKAYLLINSNPGILLNGDTVLTVREPITSIQIKCFLEMQDFIFRGPQLIDTLYSPRIKPVRSDTYQSIFLQFDLRLEDFYRVKLTDTIFIKSNRRLNWHNVRFKKLK